MTSNPGKWVVPKNLINPPGYTGGIQYGLAKWCQWSGGDAITPTTPRAQKPRLEVPIGVLKKPDWLTYREAAVNRVLKAGPGASQKALRKELRRTRRMYQNDLLQFREQLAKRKAVPSAPRKKRVRTLLEPKSFTKVIETLSTPVIWNGRGYWANLGYPSGALGWRTVANMPPKLDYDVLEKLHAAAYGAAFNPGVFVAEMPQALRMIRDSAARLTLALRYLKRGQLRSVFRTLGPPDDATFQRIETLIHGRPAVRRAKLSSVTKERLRAAENVLQTREGLKHVSGIWLELQYGWKPLLSDMDSGARYIASCLNPPLGSTSVRARKRYRQEFTSAPDQYSVGFTKLTVDWRIQYIIYNVRKEPRFVPSLHDITTVAWEKTPWSFVVDWVVPISGYLGALRTADALKGTVVKTVMVTNTYSEVGKGALVPFWHTPYPAPILAERIQIVRTVSEEINPVNPFRGYQNTVPDIFKSVTRTANAVALLSQQIAKVFPGGSSLRRKA